MTERSVTAETPARLQRRPNDDMPERLTDVFRAEQLAGLRLATQARVVVILLVALWVPIQVYRPGVTLYYEIMLALFAGIGILHYTLRSRAPEKVWLDYLFVSLDIILLTFALVASAYLIEEVWPPQAYMRFANFAYFFVFIAVVALSYSPKLMLWAGGAIAVCWTVGTLWVVSRPETVHWFRYEGMEEPITAEKALAVFLEPTFVDLGARGLEVVAILLVTGVLAAVVWRSRRLVISQAAAARERTNLARYFSPNIVDELSHADQPLSGEREQPVAVMFVDIVGFTRLAEQAERGNVIALLREFHARVEQVVFQHGGTLDKHLGDGVMATFGTPVSGPRDAANALACAAELLRVIDTWNQDRAARNQPVIRLSIGVHYGTAVLGDIGSERRLEFAVLGDVVNVASRLERLTRDLDCRIVISDDVVHAAHATGGDGVDRLLRSYRREAPQPLRGRDQPVMVWTCGDGRQG